MEIVEGHRWGYRYDLVFFPSQEEAEERLARVSWNSIVHIRQTQARFDPRPEVVEAGLFQTSCIDLRQDEESLLAGMNQLTRRQLRKAERLGDGLIVRRNEPGDDRRFLDLHNRFSHRNGHRGAMSDRRLREYLVCSDVWTVGLEGDLMCARLMLRDAAERRVRFLYEGNRRHEGPRQAEVTAALSRHLHWQAMRFYRTEGYELYDVGGIGDGTNSIARFKLGLGGLVVEDRSYVLAGRAAHLAWQGFRLARPA